MPSKHIPETSDSASVDFVEELVAAIDHNLRLKSRHHSICKQKRVSPYVLPNSRNKVSHDESTDGFRNLCKYCSKTLCEPLKNKKNCCCRTTEVEDPYEMLQDLLREGSLIKEAVKRLQLGLDRPKPPKSNHYEMDSDLELHNTSLCAI